MVTSSILRRFFQVTVTFIIVLLLTGYVSHRLIWADIYIHRPHQLKLQPVPAKSFSFRDIPIIGRFFGRRNGECGTVVQTKTPQMLFKHWQVYHKPDLPMVSAWGAFMDTRVETGDVVRVFAVSEEHKNREIFCQLWAQKMDSNITFLVVVEAESKVIGRGLNRHTVQYYEYLYSCVVPQSYIPYSVSLVFDKCENSTINLPIVTPERSEKFPHQYGICVAAAYDRIEPARLVEWIEMNKILGVTEINVYNSNLFTDSLEVLRHYQSEGIVKIHDAPPPIPSWDYWPRKLAVIPGLNDCMYRNMYRHNYTVVIDFDEVIVPHNQMTYDEMLEKVNAFHSDQDPNRPSLEFRNSYFFLDETPQGLTTDRKQLPKALIYPRYQRRSRVSGPGYSVKSITNPRRCVVMMNHYCRVTLPGHKGNFSLHVDPNFALNRHYKLCHLGRKCSKMVYETTNDDTMLKYLDELTTNVQDQYKKLDMEFN